MRKLARSRGVSIILLALGVASLPRAGRAADVEGAFGVDDYFRLQKITQVTLSPDGTTVAYVVRAGAILAYYSDKLSAEEKRSVSTVYLQPVADGKSAVAADLINDAQSLVWLPGSRELAFVSARAGAPQVFSYDTRTREVRQRTRSSDGVESFRFAADGKTLAYVTRASTPPSKNLYSELQNGDHGIVIDSNTLSVYDFVDPANDVARRPLPAVLHVLPVAGEPFDVPVPGEPGSGVGSYHWSSDGRSLSVTYIARDIRPSLIGRSRTSLGVFDVAGRGFRSLGKAIEPQPPRAGTRYEGGEWLPGQNKLLVRRVTESDPWVSPNYPDWAVADASSGLAGASWHPVSAYGSGMAFLPMGRAGILLEDTREGVRSLFRLSANGVERSEFVSGLDGSTSLARFSDDFSTAAFVNESLTRPPELYVRQGASPPRRITALNLEIARRVRHTAREVTWKSTDGVTVHGWLLEPAGAGKGPWPMITHVHGGPGFAYANSFAPYFEIWPYPFEVLAARGVAILVPNYRGTESYGRAFASPRRLDGEPVDDVITGVKEMIEGGVADFARLGISGHSHGAWLGPLVMARAKLFRAGSFAEGGGNEVVLYSLMPGDLNRQVHDVMNGVSFWDDPRPYLEASPDMSFKGVHTASLWEAGAKSGALLMFGYPKAARHFGAPSEFIVYPKTGHNPNLPSIQRESANRNLDWFEFWLRGAERGAAEKPEQYERWKEMESGSPWASDYLRSH
jgi:dipeptidyl aminopeptidase/acylaminoacyl peptidase